MASLNQNYLIFFWILLQWDDLSFSSLFANSGLRAPSSWIKQQLGRGLLYFGGQELRSTADALARPKVLPVEPHHFYCSFVKNMESFKKVCGSLEAQ